MPNMPVRDYLRTSLSCSCLKLIKHPSDPCSIPRGGGTSGDEDEYARSRKIDKELHRAKKNMKKEVKLLLLGAGESGKSTFVKQMKILHGHETEAFNVEEYRQVIYNNVIRGMKVLIDARNKLSIPWEDDSNSVYADHVFRLENHTNLTPDQFAIYASSIFALWKDRGIRTAYDRRNEFCVSDGVSFLMDNLNRISNPDYIPTNQDILHARKATKAITEYSCIIQDIPFRFVDVGGQRSQRQKWFTCFDSVTSILFFVASSEYDQVLVEDKATNRLLESLNIFDTIINNKCFTDVAMILFLNKADILQKKIERSRPGQVTPQLKPTPEIRITSSIQSTTDLDEEDEDNHEEEKPMSPLILENSVQTVSKLDSSSISLTSVSSYGEEDEEEPEEPSLPLPINKYLTDYTGDPFNVTDVQQYMINLFDSVRRVKKKSVFSHCTTAVDTENIKYVFNDVRSTILQKNITTLMLQ